VIGVLVPHAAGADPLAAGGPEHAHARLAVDAVLDAGDVRVVLAVGVGDDHDVGLAVVVDVRDDGVLDQGGGGVAALEQHVSGRALVDPEAVLVGIDDLGLAVAVEVEHRTAGRGRGAVDGLLDPQQRVGPGDLRVDERGAAEHGVADAAGGADVGDAVAVEVGDRGRAAAVGAAPRVGRAGGGVERAVDVDGAADDDEAVGGVRVV